MQNKTDYNFPDTDGHFGVYGGKYVPETLITPLKELEETYFSLKSDPGFLKELHDLNKEYTGRPTPLTYADSLTKHYG